MSLNTPPPEDWETEREDEFRQRSPGMVEAYDGTTYPDPNKNTIRFTSMAQHIRFLHHKTGRSVDELWEEYEDKLERVNDKGT